MSTQRTTPARVPPRWFIRLAWSAHRGLFAITKGRKGLWLPRPHATRGIRWGVLKLTTVGRRTRRLHSVFVGYIEDGPNLVTLAMNGWAASEPAWWLNLQTYPGAAVDMVNSSRLVGGRAAHGDERARLWARWQELNPKLDAYAARRPIETAVVILEPRTSSDNG